MMDKELYEQKSNIFDHIFYEFEMYIRTYQYLMYVVKCPLKSHDNQFWINVLHESHATHLRNLIHFFSGKDSINANTVLRENAKLGISRADEKCKTIDKAISHLTEERIVSDKNEKNLNTAMSKLVADMWPEICNSINKYLRLLSEKIKMKTEYISCFEEPKIQERYSNLKEIVSKGGTP